MTTLGIRTAAALALDLFAEQAASHPAEVAVRRHDAAWSYAEMDRWSAAVAAGLAAAGAGPGDLVALSAERSPAMIAAVLAVLRTGAGYLALDPQAPERWRLDLLAQAQPRCLLVTADAPRLDAAGLARVEIAPEPPPGPPDAPGVAPPVVAAPDDAVFQLAPTSGTTGRPRLVRISYRAMVGRLEWMWRDYPFPPGSAVAVHKAPALVASPWEMLGGLLQGVPSVVLDRAEVVDPRLLADVVAEQGITHLYLTPHIIAGLVAEAERVGGLRHRMRLVTSGADVLPAGLARRFRQAFPGVLLLNLYGMTETSSNIAAYDTAALPEAAPRVPVGRPVAGARITIHDGHGRLVPVGVTGEIRVAGRPVALGYHGDEARTRERFGTGRDGAVVLRTGDRGRWLPGGLLEVLGRADNQVKIRGYRVELEELDAALASADGVTQASACVLDQSGEPQLAGCVLADTELDLTELRAYLHGRLPEYLVPARLLQLGELPRGASGKVDRAALAALAGRAGQPEQARAYQPADPGEQLVARCWAELLGAPPLDGAQSFFEAGGHSMLAIQLIAVLEEESGHRIDLRAMFADPSVTGIAAELGSAGAATGASAGDWRGRE